MSAESRCRDGTDRDRDRVLGLPLMSARALPDVRGLATASEWPPTETSVSVPSTPLCWPPAAPEGWARLLGG